MDDALLVRGAEAPRNRNGVVDRLARREAPSGELRAQRFAFEQLLHDVGGALVLPDVVDGRNVGMIEAASRLRLQLEPPQTIRVAREGRRQHLDRDFALEPFVPRPIHLPHPTSAKRCKDLVGAETSTGWECHSVTVARILDRQERVVSRVGLEPTT